MLYDPPRARRTARTRGDVSDMDTIDTSGKALVDHWNYAVEKGLMNANTAGALRAACTQVLGVLDGWEFSDVRRLDVDDLCRRFQNKRNKDFKPESLETYKRRFALAVREFLKYADDPGSWRAPGRERPVKRERRGEANGGGLEGAAGPLTLNELLTYPFPLREGRIAQLRLPADLKMAEVRRLTAYLKTLAVDFTPEDAA